MRPHNRVNGAPIVNPGLFQHRITWEQKVVTGQDDLGQDEYAWEPMLTTKCQALARAGNEKELAFQRWAEAQFLFKMNFVDHDAIKREMRGIWGTRTMNVIDAEDPYGTRAWTHVVAKEWVE